MLVVMTVLTWDGAVTSEVVAALPRCAAEEWDQPVQVGAGLELGSEEMFGDTEGHYGIECFQAKLQPWLQVSHGHWSRVLGSGTHNSSGDVVGGANKPIIAMLASSTVERLCSGWVRCHSPSAPPKAVALFKLELQTHSWDAWPGQFSGDQSCPSLAPLNRVIFSV